jgi:hypothetical protein
VSQLSGEDRAAGKLLILDSGVGSLLHLSPEITPFFSEVQHPPVLLTGIQHKGPHAFGPDSPYDGGVALVPLSGHMAKATERGSFEPVSSLGSGPADL